MQLFLRPIYIACGLDLSRAVTADHAISSIAFPCISTGVYRFPADAAAEIAVRTVSEALPTHPGIREVVFCCFSDADLRLYRSLLDAVDTC